MASADKHPISPPPEPPTEELQCRLFIYLLFVYLCNPSCYIGRRQLIISVIDLLTGTPHQKSHASAAETNCLESSERFSPPFFLSKGSFFQSCGSSQNVKLRHLKQHNDHSTTHDSYFYCWTTAILAFKGYNCLLLGGFQTIIYLLDHFLWALCSSSQIAASDWFSWNMWWLSKEPMTWQD